MYMDDRDMMEIETMLMLVLEITHERTKRGWSKKLVAERADVSYQAYARFENGVTLVSVRTLLRVLSLFNLRLKIIRDTDPKAMPSGRPKKLKEVKFIPPKEVLAANKPSKLASSVSRRST